MFQAFACGPDAAVGIGFDKLKAVAECGLVADEGTNGYRT